MRKTVGIVAAALFAGVMLGLPAAAQEKAHRLAACKSDIEKYCASEPRGKGKIRACLEANKDKLVPECKTALEASTSAQGQ
jgi:Cysteine rich repeat